VTARRDDACRAGVLVDDEPGLAGGHGLKGAVDPARAGIEREEGRRSEKYLSHGEPLHPVAAHRRLLRGSKAADEAHFTNDAARQEQGTAAGARPADLFF
jgi:hypothetical protein